MTSEVRDSETARKYFEAGLKAADQGDRRGAIDALEAAYTVDPDNPEICFKLAYYLDLSGEESEAVHLYESAVQCEHPALNALLNLAVLYEDRGDYTKAERCLRQVLTTDPNHVRARMFMKDVLASSDMVIDEEETLREEKHNALLDTPVTDFDLSVRARNALRKMNVRTLGDLLKVTEAELRSFKNFGEASLEEIKTMLAQRGLRLGQTTEDQQALAKDEAYQKIVAQAGDDEKLNRSVAELDLSVRARKALALLNIHTIGELCFRTEAELMGVKNFGMTSLTEIKEKLAEAGLSLRQLDGDE